MAKDQRGKEPRQGGAMPLPDAYTPLHQGIINKLTFGEHYGFEEIKASISADEAALTSTLQELLEGGYLILEYPSKWAFQPAGRFYALTDLGNSAKT